MQQQLLPEGKQKRTHHIHITYTSHTHQILLLLLLYTSNTHVIIPCTLCIMLSKHKLAADMLQRLPCCQDRQETRPATQPGATQYAQGQATMLLPGQRGCCHGQQDDHDDVMGTLLHCLQSLHATAYQGIPGHTTAATACRCCRCMPGHATDATACSHITERLRPQPRQSQSHQQQERPQSHTPHHLP